MRFRQCFSQISSGQVIFHTGRRSNVNSKLIFTPFRRFQASKKEEKQIKNVILDSDRLCSTFQMVLRRLQQKNCLKKKCETSLVHFRFKKNFLERLLRKMVLFDSRFFFARNGRCFRNLIKKKKKRNWRYFTKYRSSLYRCYVFVTIYAWKMHFKITFNKQQKK